MITQKNSLDSANRHAYPETHSTLTDQSAKAVMDFVHAYNERAMFFSESFIGKVKEGSRKALTELQRMPFPPTPMDLRKEFAKCVDANVDDGYAFEMKDGKVYHMRKLRTLVHEWALLGERALMESDPALADRLMTSAQWNAKSAFEVAFVNATNELNEIKKKKQAPSSLDHYTKWYLEPLRQALAQIKELNPPENSMIGYGKRISLREAVAIAQNIHLDFQKAVSK